MTTKANGRSALILATGLFAGLLVCLAGPTLAAANDDDAAASAKPEAAPGAPIMLNKDAKHASHHWKKVAHHKSGKMAEKSAPGTNATDGDNSTALEPAAIPPSVANANAQLTQADSPTGNAQAMSARANTMLQATPDQPADTSSAAAATNVVSADQLNDVDRALHENAAPAAAVAMASADAPAVAARNENATENSTWDQTSLIGKIFIGFGALLTMASAARMFMA
jgi:hypothetical protein